MSSETGDVFIENVTEEEVSRDFSGRYTITTRAEAEEPEEDTSRLLNPRSHTFKHFTFQHLRYVWSERDQAYERLTGLESDTPVSSLFNDLGHGIPGPKVATMQQLHGPNLVSIKVPSYFSLLIDEVLHPFYIFQVRLSCLHLVIMLCLLISRCAASRCGCVTTTTTTPPASSSSP